MEIITAFSVVAFVLCAIVLAMLLSIPLMYLRAWAASWLWLWFITPMGVELSPTLHQWVGIFLLITMARGTKVKKKNEEFEWKQIWQAILTEVAGVPMFVGIGWLIHHYAG